MFPYTKKEGFVKLYSITLTRERELLITANSFKGALYVLRKEKLVLEAEIISIIYRGLAN